MSKAKFDLSGFKKTIKVTEAQYKKAKYVEIDPELQEVIKLPGIPLGAITFSYGLSDTAKTSLIFEEAARCQAQGILPVIILTGPEKKVDWSRARKMGVAYTGDLPETERNTDEFIIVEEGLDYIEDVFEFINNKIINEVERGKLPFDVMIFWDSAGNTLCKGAIKVNEKTGVIETKDMHMKAAKVLGENLLILSDRVANSRKETRPYFIGCHFITSMYQGEAPFPGAPRPWVIKGGNKVKFVSSLMIRHQLIQKLKATKDGADLKFGMSVRLSVTKNHINGQEYSGEFVVTEDRILANDKEVIDEYKKSKSAEWGNFEVLLEGGEVFEPKAKKSISFTGKAEELDNE